MTTISTRAFSAVESIQKLRKANFTETQAEVLAEIIEQQAQNIHQQQIELIGLKNKELATKGDIRESELRLQKELQKEIRGLEVKLMTIYAGGFLILLGVLAKGFHWL